MRDCSDRMVHFIDTTDHFAHLYQKGFPGDSGDWRGRRGANQDRGPCEKNGSMGLGFTGFSLHSWPTISEVGLDESGKGRGIDLGATGHDRQILF
jgi:hypothetical protein